MRWGRVALPVEPRVETHGTTSGSNKTPTTAEASYVAFVDKFHVREGENIKTHTKVRGVDECGT